MDPILPSDGNGREHYLKKLSRPFENTLQDRQEFQPPRLMPYFLLTEAVTTTASQNKLTEAGTLKIPALVNID
jgi:hypothetical protein